MTKRTVNKRKAQTLNMFENPDYQKTDEREEGENSNYRSPELNRDSLYIYARVIDNDLILELCSEDHDYFDYQSTLDISYELGVPSFIKTNWTVINISSVKKSTVLPIYEGSITSSDPKINSTADLKVRIEDFFFPIDVHWDSLSDSDWDIVDALVELDYEDEGRYEAPSYEGMKNSSRSRKNSHHLWQSTATSDGDVTIHRTKAEREDLDDFEFVQAKAASFLGLWGASMTDSPLFSRVPARSASVFGKTAKEMKAAGEVPPKVMTWAKLAKAFGAKRVNDCRENIQFGMKTRLVSKELNIPFVMAADLVEDWETVGGKVLAGVVASVKKKSQWNPVNDEVKDDNYFGEVSDLVKLRKTSPEDADDYYNQIIEVYGVSPERLEKDIQKAEQDNIAIERMNASKVPARLASKVRRVLASDIPKIAIDQAAKEYYKAYYGPFGEQLVKEVKKRVKADLARIWLVKQGVDQAAAEYWSNYYTDQNYGELMSADPKKRPGVKGRYKMSQTDTFHDKLEYFAKKIKDLKSSYTSLNSDNIVQALDATNEAYDELAKYLSLTLDMQESGDTSYDNAGLDELDLMLETLAGMQYRNKEALDYFSSHEYKNPELYKMSADPKKRPGVKGKKKA